MVPEKHVPRILTVLAAGPREGILYRAIGELVVNAESHPRQTLHPYMFDVVGANAYTACPLHENVRLELPRQRSGHDWRWMLKLILLEVSVEALMRDVRIGEYARLEARANKRLLIVREHHR